MRAICFIALLALLLAAAGCQSSSDLPDPTMTPGATLPVTTDDICVSGYTKLVRNVPIDMKRQVYTEYGITHHHPGDYEVDHLISLELGGSNSLKNLWPQSYKTRPWNAHVKDALENELHDEVCSGQIALPAAQHEIATNWIAAYKKHFQPRVVVSTPTASSGQVWVNFNSGKYFYPGARYYGRTKRGQYLPESEAIKQGYIAAGGQ